MTSVATGNSGTSSPRRRIFISTGEVSGDLQGALLVEALYQVAADRDIDLEIYALGGRTYGPGRGKAAGGHYRPWLGGGFLRPFPTFCPPCNCKKRVRADLLKYPPDLAVLIDYMTPNLKIGRDLRRFFSRGAGGLLHCSPAVGMGLFPERYKANCGQ